MLEMLEKLINEHGSSTILRERLELFSDKYSMLEDKNKHIIERNEELESQLEKAKQEITRLQEIIDSNKATQTTEELENPEIEILKLLFNSNQQLFASQISQHIQIPIGNTEYHLNNLMEKELLDASYNTVEDTRYYISTNGRAYVVKNT